MIVIVVIAILAAISIVAYNGIQERVQNTSRVAAARQTLNLLEMHRAAYGAYPELPPRPSGHGGTRGACIGTGWPRIDGVDTPVCHNIYLDGQGPGPSTYPEDDDVNAALSEFGTLPDYPQESVFRGERASGRPLELKSLRFGWGPERGYYLHYLLPGGADCGLSQAEAEENPLGTQSCYIYLGD